MTSAERDGGVVVATHNLMDGRYLDRLFPHYLALRDEVGLDALCVQENAVFDDGGAGEGGADGVTCAERIALALGPDWVVLAHADAPRLAIAYDGRTLHAAEPRVISLPPLDRLSWIERRYIRSGAPEPRQALVARFERTQSEDSREDSPAVTVVDFHLDTAGGNAHRRGQVAHLASALADIAADAGALVACGDTNAFTLRRRRHADALADVLSPLAALGLRDEGGAPTHFFARQDEPHLTHQLCVVLGKLGLDLPRRYDVVYTNAPTTARGQVSTPGSDHDLVWAAIEPPRV